MQKKMLIAIVAVLAVTIIAILLLILLKSIRLNTTLTIVIDAGHGGDFSGSTAYDEELGKEILEKDITLEYAEMLKEKIEEKCKQEGKRVRVILTRNKDTQLNKSVELDLLKRCEIANKNNADVFISIHTNWFEQESASGTETFYNSEKDTIKNVQQTYGITSEEVAKKIHEGIIEATNFRDREIKEDNFSVIKNTDMPSILIELGFISNNEDRRNLLSDEYKHKITESIANSLYELFKDTKN